MANKEFPKISYNDPLQKGSHEEAFFGDEDKAVDSAVLEPELAEATQPPHVRTPHKKRHPDWYWDVVAVGFLVAVVVPFSLWFINRKPDKLGGMKTLSAVTAKKDTPAIQRPSPSAPVHASKVASPAPVKAVVRDVVKPRVVEEPPIVPKAVAPKPAPPKLAPVVQVPPRNVPVATKAVRAASPVPMPAVAVAPSSPPLAVCTGTQVYCPEGLAACISRVTLAHDKYVAKGTCTWKCGAPCAK